MSRVGRVAALGAVVAASVLVALILFGGGGGAGYTVTGKFLNAAQLVEGNLVQVGGTEAGAVKDIDISPDGQAVVEMEIKDPYVPLRAGTKAVIRQASQSGIANRYVDLRLPDGDATATIDDGGSIGVDETVTPVELDQLFNTFTPDTRKSVQAFLQNSARQFEGKGSEANRGWRYLNPSLSTASRLFRELNRDTPVLERFLVDSAKLVTALAERRDDLSGLVHNLNLTTRALGNQKVALADAIRRFPDFMRTSNTTFVNLRGTLDDVDPLVSASKPVAKKLRPFFDELRPLARDARPTLRDLSAIIRQKGDDNDLVELNRTFPPLARVALDEREINGASRRGAFPEMTQALTDSAPTIAEGRPYTVDLFGWFDDFSHTGVYDALGGISRTQVYVNAASLPGTGITLPGIPFPIAPLQERGENYKRFVRLDQYKRCPGAAEEAAADGSNVFSEEEQKALDCVEAHRGTGAR